MFWGWGLGAAAAFFAVRIAAPGRAAAPERPINPGPGQADQLVTQRAFAAAALFRAGISVPGSAGPMGWRTPSLWSDASGDVPALGGGAGPAMFLPLATVSVPSSEAATLPDETPRVDEPEGPIGGEAVPGQPGAVTPGYAPASPPRSFSPPRPASWWTRGPPSGAVSTRGNSWLYVPLLHAAAGTLARTAFEEWTQQTTGWLPMVQHLQEAAPADVDAVRLVLRGLGAHQAAERLPDTTSRAVSLPLAAIASSLVEADGYFHAAVQETLVEAFAGQEAAAQLLRSADAFRLVSATRPELHPSVEATPELEPGEGSLPTRRVQQGRQRGARGGARNQVDVVEAAMQRGLDALNDIDLAAVLRVRTLTLQGAPGWLRGLLAFALRAGLRPIRDAPGDARAQETAGWKLFMLAPRMLLSRARGQARIALADLEQRVRLLKAGEWAQLLQPAQAPAGVTSGRPPPDSLEARGERAAALAHLGELSAAARALTAEPLAPGNEETLQELRDPARRPQVPRVPVPEAVLQHQPSEPVRLSWGAFVSNVRRARRGAAPGPSDCTNDHLRLLLETEEDMQLLHHAAQKTRARGRSRHHRPGASPGPHGGAAQAERSSPRPGDGGHLPPTRGPDAGAAVFRRLQHSLPALPVRPRDSGRNGGCCPSRPRPV